MNHSWKAHSRRQWTLALTAFLVLWLSSYHFIYSRFPQLSPEEGRFRITDFAFYVEIVRAFWFTGDTEVYASEVSQRIVSRLAGRELGGTLALNVLPTAFLVFLPFALFARVEVAAAGWCAATAVLFGLAIWNFLGTVPRIDRYRAALLVVVLILLLTSESLTTGVILGQTSLLAVALLLYLQCGADDRPVWREAAALVALSIKPQYLAMGTALLLIRRRPWSVAIGGAVFAAGWILLSFRLGWKWPLQYAEVLRLYTGGPIPLHYRDVLAVEGIGIFRYAALPLLGEPFVSYLSWLILGGVYVAAVLASVVFGQSAQQGAVALFAGYLLFAPHLNPYEEVMAMNAAVGAVLWGKKASLPVVVTLVGALAVQLNYVELHHSSHLSPAAIWMAKLVASAVIPSWVLRNQKQAEADS